MDQNTKVQACKGRFACPLLKFKPIQLPSLVVTPVNKKNNKTINYGTSKQSNLILKGAPPRTLLIKIGSQSCFIECSSRIYLSNNCAFESSLHTHTLHTHKYTHFEVGTK